MSGRFSPGERVVVEHPRYGRHYGTVVGPHEHDEPAYVVRVEGNYVNPDWPVLGAWMQEPRGQRDMVIGDLLNLQMLKEAIERPFLGTLWTEGDSGILTPFVCECSFGDGLKLLAISTINQRPNYHVVRVDSSWDVSNWSYAHNVGEHIDEIITGIEDECGPAGDYLDDPCDNCGDTCCKCGPDFDLRAAWPSIDPDDGCSWGFVCWRRLMDQICYTAMIERLRSPQQ